ncbi:MAG: PHP domain-containing protein, partial [Clostridiales bacterium]|nr:PHP domain-containing protein [Clostridiales bacterium]
MNQAKPFLEAFPGLDVDPKIRALLEYVKVERITVNHARNRLKIYIVSENWLKKQHIYRLEDAISAQVFGNAGRMEVKVIEHFVLSGSYSASNFYKAYRSSMVTELKNVDPLLEQAFLHSELTFGETEDEAGRKESTEAAETEPQGGCSPFQTVTVTVPDSAVFLREQDRLIAYVEKIFCERAGFKNVEVLGKVSKKKAASAREADDLQIEEKIREVMERNEKRHAGVTVEKKLPVKEEKQYSRRHQSLAKDASVLYGRAFDDEPDPISSLGDDPREVTVRGEVFATESRETRSGRIIFTVAVTDYTDSLRFKLWFDKEDLPEYESVFRKGSCFVIKGLMDLDPYDREMMIKSVYGIRRIPPFREAREDHATVKRVELHCHTQMSDMDAVASATSIVKQAYRFGMKAIAITDHGVVQAFPEAKKCFGGKGGIPKDADLKVIYGMEGYLVDDMKNLVGGAVEGRIDGPCVVFDVVTTGQSPFTHDIIEIAAQKIEGGRLTEEFSTLVNPGRPIPFSIQTEVGITDNMVISSPDLEHAMRAFAEFAGSLPLIAYDADQGMNFILAACERYGIEPPGRTFIDIPAVARYLLPGLGKIRFRTLIRHLKVPNTDEMRAFPRARSMAMAYLRLLEGMESQNIVTFGDLNAKGAVSVDRIRNLKYYHIILLAKNEIGRRNLYTLVSESHLKYFKTRPRIPRSVLNAHREGLILGSACSAGELYQAILSGASDAEIARIVGYYDYLEIQPTGNNNYLIGETRSGIRSVEDLRDINRRIVRLGDQFRKPVCATCDVHFLNPEDAIYRSIIQAGHGFTEEASGQPPLYLRTTEEMLAEFSYLGEEKCREVVITNTNRIAEQIGDVSPIYPYKCPPSIPHAAEDLEAMCYETAREWYGDPIPELVR